jgi:general secretion pathway protein A
MYEKYYGFITKPFALTPDPEFFYLSQDHLDAIEHMIYGITEGEGFLLLVGKIGTGKTTTSRVLSEKLGESVIHSLILNPFQDFFSLVKNILWDMGVIPEGVTTSELINQLIEFLLNEVGPKGKTALIIIDEAQNLSVETLEQLRVLSNVETDKEKLIQVLLLGQEELLSRLEAHELRQLNQRITVRFFLNPLERSEVLKYMQHRIERAGARKKITFTRSAVREIYRFSRGVPRLINMIANRCLIAGFVRETAVIDKSIVKRARESLYGGKHGEMKKKKFKENLLDKLVGILQSLQGKGEPEELLTENPGNPDPVEPTGEVR